MNPCCRPARNRRRLGVEEIELDEPKAGEILVKTAAACATPMSTPMTARCRCRCRSSAVTKGRCGDRARPGVTRWVITSRARSSRRVASAPGALAASEPV